MNFDTYSVQYLNLTRFAFVLVSQGTGYPAGSVRVVDPSVMYKRKDGQYTIKAYEPSNTVTFKMSKAHTVLGLRYDGTLENLTAPDLSTHEGRVQWMRNDAATQSFVDNSQRVKAIIEFRKHLITKQGIVPGQLKWAVQAFDAAFPDYVTPPLD